MELASRRLLGTSGCGLGRDAGLLSGCQTVSVPKTVRDHAEENGGDEDRCDECKHTSDIHRVSANRVKIDVAYNLSNAH